MFFKEIRVKRYLKKDANKINIASTFDNKAKGFNYTKICIASLTFGLIFVLSILLIKYVIGNTKANYFPSTSSEFSSKYEFFKFTAAKISLKSEFNLNVFPEIQNQKLKDIHVSYSGRTINVFYEDYQVAVTNILNRDPSSYDIDANYESKIIENEGVRYLIKDKDNMIYFVKDEFAITIRIIKSSEYNLFDVLNFVKFVQYEFIGDDIVRGKVYDDSKTLKYNFDGKETELIYMYKEINYNLCIEYDVYTDGINDFMFDENGKLIGYRINDSMFLSNELNKYVDISKLKLEKQQDGNSLYTQYVNKLKTNGFAFVRHDKSGNITELFINEVKIEGNILDINEKLLIKEIKRRLNRITIEKDHYLELDKINQFRYTVDEVGDIIVICDVIADVKAYESKTLEVDKISMIVFVKVNNCIN